MHYRCCILINTHSLHTTTSNQLYVQSINARLNIRNSHEILTKYENCYVQVIR
jgi:hypothetical protein